MNEPITATLVARVERPTARETAAARRAYRSRGNLCGCYAQLSRNPFYSGVVGHFMTFHAEAIDMLRDIQAQALIAIAAELAGARELPWAARSLPMPVRIG